MQTRVFPIDNEYGNCVKRNGRFESDDQRLQDFSQLQMAACSLGYFKYELCTGLSCVSHLRQEYHGSCRRIVYAILAA